MKLKINPFYYINISLFTSFFFLWSLNTSPFIKKNFLNTTTFFKIETYLNIDQSLYLAKYLILLLIFPILLKLFKQRKFISISKTFNHHKYIILLIFFVITHFFLANFINNQIIESQEIYKLIFFCLLSIIFINYRYFLKRCFEHILLFYLILCIFSSYYFTENLDFFSGGCSVNSAFYLNSNFNISITNILFKENSHLSMVMIAVTLCNILIITSSKKINFLYLLLFILSSLIVFFNYSTTFYIGYSISLIIIAIFLNKKISIKFWIFSFLFLILNTIIFFGDKDCTKKVTDLSLKNIIKKNINKDDLTRDANIDIEKQMTSKNLTSLIYERSAILTLDTFQYYPFGWGFDGMDNATKNLVNKDRYVSEEIFIGDGITKIFYLKNEVFDTGTNNFRVGLDTLDKSDRKLDPEKINYYDLGAPQELGEDFLLDLDDDNKRKRITFKTTPKKGDIIYVNKDIYIFTKILNLSDGLSNFFKILNEFGIFSLFILYFFIKYLLKIEKVSTYNLFVITMFITMSIRGAGYFNGGFLFCLLELFYIKKINDKKN